MSPRVARLSTNRGFGPRRRWGDSARCVWRHSSSARLGTSRSPHGPTAPNWPAGVQIADVLIAGEKWATVVGVYGITIDKHGTSVCHGGFSMKTIVRDLELLLESDRSGHLAGAGDFNLLPHDVGRNLARTDLVDVVDHTSERRPLSDSAETAGWVPSVVTSGRTGTVTVRRLPGSRSTSASCRNASTEIWGRCTEVSSTFPMRGGSASRTRGRRLRSKVRAGASCSGRAAVVGGPWSVLGAKGHLPMAHRRPAPQPRSADGHYREMSSPRIQISGSLSPSRQYDRSATTVNQVKVEGRDRSLSGVRLSRTNDSAPCVCANR